MKCTLSILLAVLTFACGGSAPSSPTPTAPPVVQRWGLTGTVTASTGGALAGATLAIVDGVDAGKMAITDTSGHFAFENLQQGGFSLRVSAKGFIAITRGVTLTGNTIEGFVLSFPSAALEAIDELTVTRRADGGFDMRAAGLNSGLGCASRVQGVTTVRSKATSATLLFPWALPSLQIIQSGEKFPYDFGPMTDAQALAFPDNFYSTMITFASVPCP